MATRNSSEVERRRSRVRRTQTQARPRTQASYAATGSSSYRGSTRVSSAHSARRSQPSPRSPTRRRSLPPAAAPLMALAIQNAIEEQRGELATAMTLLHCLHCVLRRETDYTSSDESTEFEDAAGWVELPNLTAILLVRLHAIHLALDSVSLRRAVQASQS